ncbi:MAG: T9SS type A sorting domain-containing protein, partial [Cyclonatronaceae bacterium]
LQVFEFIKVSGPDKFGSLITVNPDFELTTNSENFWASDLAIIFADGPDLFASNRLLQVGGYNLFANMAIFWEDGEAGKLGTTVRAPIDIPFDFDVENLYMFLINTYIPENQQASAAWSGSIELFGVEESASFITDVEPASGELEAGESVMVTLSFEPAELGLMESALYLTSNDLQQQAIIIPVSMNGLQSIDWASLHGPATATLSPGEDFDIKGRVLAESYTEDASPAQEVSYAVGFHSENTHPEDWPESAWVSGEFSTAMENMHEYSVVTGSHLEEGTWFYATRFEFDGEGYSYGGYADEGGGFWEEGQYISGIAEIAPATSTEPETELPAVVSLSQNYPNPFNPVTLIEYALPETAEVRLDVFNMMGQQVATLVNATQPAGEHAVSFDAAGLSSGMYLYRFSSGSFIQTRKMMLLK